MIVEVLCSLGLGISSYALYVKRKMAGDSTYSPLCDISENISCSKAFGSEYSELAVLPNMFYGIIFYALMLLFWIFDVWKIAQGMAVFSTLGSLYLAYLSYVKQRNFCLVCTAIYLINIGILAASFI